MTKNSSSTNKLPTIKFEDDDVVSPSLDDNSTVISGSQITDTSTIHTQQPTRCKINIYMDSIKYLTVFFFSG